MIKNVASKTLRIRRATALFVGLAVILAATVAMASPDTAAKAKNAVFELGKKNPVKAVSTMVGTLADPILRLDNNGTGTALDLRVESGEAPLTVNPEAGTATNLSADELDGKDSSGFWSGKFYLDEESISGRGGGKLETVIISCDQGDRSLTGGARGSFSEDELHEVRTNGTSFNATVKDNGFASTITVEVSCADFPPLRP